MILTDSLKWSCGAYATSGVTSGVFACAKFTFVQDEWVLGRRGGDIRCTMLINFLLHQHRAPQVLVCTFGRSGLRHKLLLILSNPSSFVPHDNLIKSEEFFLHSSGYVNFKKNLELKLFDELTHPLIFLMSYELNIDVEINDARKLKLTWIFCRLLKLIQNWCSEIC